MGPADQTPDHSSLSKTHKRLPEEIFDKVFKSILQAPARKGLLWGEKLRIDSTTIHINALLKWIVRKDSGKGWRDYTKKLVQKVGLDDPTDAELWQLDRYRPGRKPSKNDWESLSDPDAPITRIKNSTSRLSYKTEHGVDLETTLIVSATVHPGNAADSVTVIDMAINAAVNFDRACYNNRVEASVADNGNHSTKVMM